MTKLLCFWDWNYINFFYIKINYLFLKKTYTKTKARRVYWLKTEYEISVVLVRMKKRKTFDEIRIIFWTSNTAADIINVLNLWFGEKENIYVREKFFDKYFEINEF